MKGVRIVDRCQHWSRSAFLRARSAVQSSWRKERPPTQIEDMHVSKRLVTVASAVDDHLVTDQIRRMISFADGQVTCCLPFLPSQVFRVANVQCPDVVERGMAVASAADHDVVTEDDCCMRSARDWPSRHGCVYLRSPPFVGGCMNMSAKNMSCRRERCSLVSKAQTSLV